MKLNEIKEIWNKDDIDNAPSDEKEFVIMKNDPSMWIKLGQFYNWDNPLEEILYFYDRDSSLEEIYAVSFGKADFSSLKQDSYLIKPKIFVVRFDGTLEYFGEGDPDPWEIFKGSLELSDLDSLRDIIKNIFVAPKVEVLDKALKHLR